METTLRTYNLTVPASDAGFVKTLSKKMGWSIHLNGAATAAKKKEEHSPLYYDLQSAFRDVKLMVDGKKPKKTIEEFLAELPDEEADSIVSNNAIGTV